MILFFLCVAAYLLGSVPSAVWVGKTFFGVDVREHGSKSAGATNTLRVLGKRAGFTVLFLDFLKGFLATNLTWFSQESLSHDLVLKQQMLFGVLAVVGHIYPVFAGFKGGKGVATLLGVVVALDWKLALICLLVFIAVVWFTRYISVGSMASGMVSPFVAGFLHHWDELSLVLFCGCVALMVVYTHRTNIKRLIDGQENKFAFKPKT